jgi:ADP-ribose pyrophosphatase YjhB (NUDIX family)
LTVHLATGLAVVEGRVLLVASRYANHAQPLWNLPGGRQQAGELLTETVEREVYEETGLRVRVGSLAYLGESYDGERHYLSACFLIEVVSVSSFVLRHAPSGAAQDDTDTGPSTTALRAGVYPERAQASRRAHDDKESNDHVVAWEWVAIEDLAERIVVGVVREPLLAYLRGELPQRYAGSHEAGITIEWPPDSG